MDLKLPCWVKLLLILSLASLVSGQGCPPCAAGAYETALPTCDCAPSPEFALCPGGTEWDGCSCSDNVAEFSKSTRVPLHEDVNGTFTCQQIALFLFASLTLDGQPLSNETHVQLANTTGGQEITFEVSILHPTFESDLFTLFFDNYPCRTWRKRVTDIANVTFHCQTTAGVGRNLAIRLETSLVDGVVAWTTTAATHIVSYATPEIDRGTLQFAAEMQKKAPGGPATRVFLGSPHPLPTSPGYHPQATRVYFQGTNFGTDAAQVSVTFTRISDLGPPATPVSVECVVGFVDHTGLDCFLTILRDIGSSFGDEYRFSVTVAGATTAASQDAFIVPGVPYIVAIGCGSPPSGGGGPPGRRLLVEPPGGPPDPLMPVECSLRVNVTVIGFSLCDDPTRCAEVSLTSYLGVPAAGGKCTEADVNQAINRTEYMDIDFANIIDNNTGASFPLTSLQAVSCPLEGEGQLHSVSFTQFDLSGTQNQLSLSFAVPEVVRVEGDCPLGETGLVDCARTGGNNITLFGNNFGYNLQVFFDGWILCDDPRPLPRQDDLDVTTCMLPKVDVQSSNVSIFAYHFGSRNDLAQKVEDFTINYLLCPPGTFSSRDSQECVACTTGKFNEHFDSISCFPCPLPQIPNPTATGCQFCEPGEKMDEVTYECVKCQPGKQLSEPAVECRDCLAGFFSNTTGAAECLPCEVGKFQAEPGESTCTLCPAGLVSDTAGVAECNECPDGAIAATKGLSECQYCAPGKRVESSTECTGCARGRFSDDKAVPDECEECDAGRFQNDTGKSFCYNCALGYFTQQREQSKCDPCSSDSYGEPNFTTGCLQCWDNSQQNMETRSDCDCLVGFYRDGFSCLECPKGGDCEYVGTPNDLDPLKGWAAVVSIEENYTGIPQFMRCVTEAACLGGRCKTGHMGPLCNECISGWGKNGRTCAPCSATGSRVALTIVGVLVLVVGSLLLLLNNRREALKPSEEAAIVTKIFASAFQFNGMASNITFNWTTQASYLKDWLAFSQTAGGLGTSLIALDCFLDDVNSTVSPVWAKLILFALIPLTIPLITSLYICIAKVRWSWKLWAVERRNAAGHQRPVPISPVTGGWIKDTTISGLLILLFLLHPALTRTALEWMNCTRLTGDAEYEAGQARYFLVQDHDHECAGASYWTWTALVAFPMLLIYAFGIPLVGALMVYRNRKYIQESPGERSVSAQRVTIKYSFLFKGFKTKYAWWEAVIFARKTAVSAISTFGWQGEALQGLGAIVVLIFALSAHLLALPYDDPKLNRLEFLSLIVSMTTYIAGQMSTVTSGHNAVQEVFAVLAIVLNIIFLLSCLLIFAWPYYKLVREMLGREKAHVKKPLVSTMNYGGVFPDEGDDEVVVENSAKDTNANDTNANDANKDSEADKHSNPAENQDSTNKDGEAEGDKVRASHGETRKGGVVVQMVAVSKREEETGGEAD